MRLTDPIVQALESAYPTQLAYLNSIQKSGKIHHAYLVIGSADGAHNAAAEYWAKRLVGEIGPGVAHPDIFIVRQDEVEAIRVDVARQVRGHLVTSPAIAQRRVVILEQAERCTAQAANALLKILEEPVAETVTLLTTHLPDMLPATLRSRLHKLYFPPLAAHEARQVVHELDGSLSPGRTEELVHLASGRFARLCDLVQVGDTEHALRHRAAFWVAFLEGTTGQREAAVLERFRYATKDSTALHQLQSYLETAQEVVHDIFLLATRSDQALVYVQFQDRLKVIAEQWGGRESAIRLAVLERLRAMEHHKVHKKNILDYLTIRL